MRSSASALNDRGNRVCRWRDLHYEATRYPYDLIHCAADRGWVQYDTPQDASYFGCWVQYEERLIVTFAERDVILVDCPTPGSFHLELADMARFYGDLRRLRTH
ncbi:MAG: hypothetical protein Q8S75_08200 [Nitrospirota bacterium]|nr:hypothetical protein [Nitrospirota bacterium]